MINRNNYISQIEKHGFDSLPEELQQAHLVIMEKTDDGRKWKACDDNKELKELVNLTFQKMEEFIVSNGKEELNGKPEKKPENTNLVELGFIKRFLELEDQTIWKEDMEKFIDDLQKAIQKGDITKESSFAKEITFIQKVLIDTYNTMPEHINIKFRKQTSTWMRKVLKKSESKPKKKTKKARKIPKSLNGIPEEKIPAEETIENTVKEEEPVQGVENPETKTGGNVMNSVDFSKLEFNSIGLKDKWLKLIGDPAPGFSAMVFGKPKMGKSYLCVDFAGYLARNHGPVLYVAREEKLDATLQKKLKDKEVAHPDLFVSDFLPKDLSPYQFIFIDSVNKLGLTPQDIERMRIDNPGKSFIFVFQTTKEGNFRGTNQFQHDVDVVIEVPEKGKAVQFGRFNQGGEMDIFENDDLSGIKNNNMKNKTDYPAWTTPKHLSEKDHNDLKQVFDLYQKGDLNKAYSYAAGLDTIVREEIPVNIWKNIGGKLTPKGKEKLVKVKTVKSATDLKKYADRPDDLNPQFLFSMISTQLLCEALRGDYDVMYLLRRELANRGVDENGKWVGFPQASKIHKVE